MKDLFLRTKQVAYYIVETGSTVRQASKVFGIAKSTVHYDLTKRLKFVDCQLYMQVRQILDKNFQEKNIRGGNATRKKYLIKNRQNLVQK